MKLVVPKDPATGDSMTESFSPFQPYSLVLRMLVLRTSDRYNEMVELLMNEAIA